MYVLFFVLISICSHGFTLFFNSKNQLHTCYRKISLSAEAFECEGQMCYKVANPSGKIIQSGCYLRAQCEQFFLQGDQCLGLADIREKLTSSNLEERKKASAISLLNKFGMSGTLCCCSKNFCNK